MHFTVTNQLGEPSIMSALPPHDPASLKEPDVTRGVGADTYSPNKLLDEVSQNLSVRDDLSLADALELSRSLIGKIRLGKQRIGATVLLRMQEISGIPMKKLKSILGDKHARFRIGEN